MTFFHVMAQEAVDPNLPKPEPCDTYFGLIPKKNYVCFMRKYKYDSQRASQIQPQTKSNHSSEIKKEEIYAQFKQRQKERDQQAIERSRARNVSNKGMRYRITFGRVLEPQE